MSQIRVLSILLALFAACLVAPAMAQQQSLFEALFDNNAQVQQAAPGPRLPEPEPAPAVPAQMQAEPGPVTSPSMITLGAPQAQTPAATMVAAPATGGSRQRIAVLGDSLAVDLARALERFYAADPGIVILDEGVGSSGFVRDDFFDWNAAIEAGIAADDFDIAVVMIGINDRQALGGNNPLTEPWRQTYSSRIGRALDALAAAGKTVVWLELPPMERSGYSADIAQISALQRMAVFASGAEWVETYERFSGENGGYAANGPDLNGNIVPMRKSDGIHFSSAGADKLAFYVDRAIRGTGGVSAPVAGGMVIRVADLLARTEAGGLLRPPFQGLGEESLALASGSVLQLSAGAARASTLLVAGSVNVGPGFTLQDLMVAQEGRADAFGMVFAAPDPVPDVDVNVQ